MLLYALLHKSLLLLSCYTRRVLQAFEVLNARTYATSRMSAIYRCLEIRTMPAPRPPGSPGDWTETVSVCVDCGKAIYQRDGLRIEGQKEEQEHKTLAVASAAGLARPEKQETTLQSATRPPDIFL